MGPPDAVPPAFRTNLADTPPDPIWGRPLACESDSHLTVCIPNHWTPSCRQRERRRNHRFGFRRSYSATRVSPSLVLEWEHPGLKRPTDEMRLAR
ncbi:hypothetical protein GCM10011579_079000 [Streptomyces albiflavescens]|uniref:Uncharacterized protein n=1 Tax=Streptomyces albiflavescens TaxID=1623582 RepID=A0A917YCS7_9ACTN|nr:hypothetical protein GCM10011579_079000 [Streptomyces albiflavescens]